MEKDGNNLVKSITKELGVEDDNEKAFWKVKPFFRKHMGLL